MYVLSLFDHSIKLEMVLQELEAHAITKEALFATPLQLLDNKKYIDPYNSESLNLFFVVFIGMLGMLLGAIYGFVLYLGPILWALIGLITGSGIGLLVDIFLMNKHKSPKKLGADVVLIVKCNETNVKLVEDIVVNHRALAITRV
ncbi:hypothetical protein JOD43_001282 [Pullulanibacillus pueri]|uniref:DUF1269 domain-containing protein n=1 Tax=Pullulanibacillus pueri TaxID=1437324 RepID=A0A8J2ZTQ7_9BACL|nr:hypothetical protein [Pullulanibacillus pueri]MBM7681115.1 hypothetical protein [Pullulanibacillus pueri]GGH77105.1 hypothetical protein GCM10007096_08510 [Pullulanibacillus pueri]